MTKRWTLGLASLWIVSLSAIAPAQDAAPPRNPAPPLTLPGPPPLPGGDAPRGPVDRLLAQQPPRPVPPPPIDRPRNEPPSLRGESSRPAAASQAGDAAPQRGRFGANPELGDLPAELGQTYLVTVTEFRLSEAIDARTAPSEIVELFQRLRGEGKLELVESVSLSAVESIETSVRFGKLISVTVGATVAPAVGRIRNYQQREIGTIVRVLAEPRGEQVALRVAYEASRPVGEGTDESPPDIHSFQTTSTLLLDPGVPKLVGGTVGDGTTFLIVEVTN